MSTEPTAADRAAAAEVWDRADRDLPIPGRYVLTRRHLEPVIAAAIAAAREEGVQAGRGDLEALERIWREEGRQEGETAIRQQVEAVAARWETEAETWNPWPRAFAKDLRAAVAQPAEGAHVCSRWCAQHTALGGPLDPAQPAKGER